MGEGPIERWPEVSRILDLAIEASEEARDSVLARECAGDPELRETVRTLLDALVDGHGLLDQPAIDLVRRLRRG